MISQPRWQSTGGDENVHETSSMAEDGSPQSTREAIDAVFKHVAEVRDYALLYVETRKDQVKVAVRQAITYAVLGLLALMAGATVLVVSVVLVLGGVAGGIGQLVGGQLWAGQLITGGVVISLAALTVYFAIRSATTTSRRKLGQKYERRRKELQTRFGHQPSPRCEMGESPQRD